MTNLEKMKDEIKHYSVLCVASHTCKYGKGCLTKRCSDCEFYNNVDECIDVLLSEYKEPVKLKRWEKDLLDTLVYGNNSYRQSKFYNVLCLEGMKRRHGYFRGVTDISMTIGEILENCEIVD